MATVAEIVKNLKEDCARVKSYLRRDEILRAVDRTATMLETYSQTKVVGSTRFEVEVSLDDVLAEISRHSSVRALLPVCPNGKPLVLKIVRGKERLVSTVLTRMAQAMRAETEERAQEEQRKLEEHRQGLLRSGQECLDRGEMARARVFLHRCLEEFGRKEPDLYADVAERFRAAGLPLEAAVAYEKGIEAFPKDPTRYAAAIKIYTSMREFEKAEHLYDCVLRQFGVHPRTMLNLAKLYLEWHKKDKAADAAYRALSLDASMNEAKELLEQLEGKASTAGRP